MTTKTETLTMPLMHVYHLTADPANTTGYTIEQVTTLIEEHGPDHKIEITITTPVPEPQPEVVETTAEEVVEVIEEPVVIEEPTLDEMIADGYNTDARDGDSDVSVQYGTEWERPVDIKL